jgi:scyllo-inositol 2-dehydrogenase (NADP+)
LSSDMLRSYANESKPDRSIRGSGWHVSGARTVLREDAIVAMRVVPVGLLGFGMAGSIFHTPVIKAVPGLSIRTVMTTRDADVARDLPGVAVTADAQAIFDDPAIELVVIATPNVSHFALARRALEAGKHVVIDKPMTIASTQADMLIAVARERGRLLSVYQNRRWDGDFQTVARLVASGRLGHISLYEAHYDRFRPAIKAGWREQPAPGSGVLYDLGAHLIDQALLLFGLPDTVTADVLVQRPGALVDDYFSIVLGYPNRRAIVRASTLVIAPGPHFALHGDAASFLKFRRDPQEAALKAGVAVGSPGWGVDPADAYGTLVNADGTREAIPTIPGAYADFYAAMAAAIVDGTPVPVAARDARNVIAIIEQARRSALERRTVAVV